ncbi:MAG: ATP-binding protein [Bacteroidaceae bacterium]|nr:ATP-binding protein [Bacteroidaceae bacterium]
MKNADYKNRLIDEKVKESLQLFGAVCIEGPKWCGKTWTSTHHCSSRIMLGDPEGDFQNKRMAEVYPSIVLEGEVPHLIDEWQEVPRLWDAVRYEVDQRGRKGQFLLTGSSTPKIKGVLHSGAGRIKRLRMYPMSLWESGDSTGDVSLKDLFNGNVKAKMITPAGLKNLIYLCVRGGWPGAIGVKEKHAGDIAKAYIDTIQEYDIFKIDDKQYDTKKISLLMRSLARNEATTVSIKSLAKDISEKDDVRIDTDTLSRYLTLLDRLFLLRNQPAFDTNIRSSIRVKQMEKRHFTDPSIACALLGARTDRLLADLKTFGFMFEAMVERDLQIYAESIGGKLYHYQDYNGSEIDAVIELEDGRWGAFEIKLGADRIDEGAASLLKVRANMLASNPQAHVADVMCVICGMANAIYQRPDGVWVVPITALKE